MTDQTQTTFATQVGRINDILCSVCIDFTILRIVLKR